MDAEGKEELYNEACTEQQFFSVACQLFADEKTIKDNVVDEIFNIFEDFLRAAIQFLLQV